MLHYSENVIRIIQGKSFERFRDDITIYYSVMKNVEIVGEAAYMLTKEFCEQHATLPWKEIAGMRHVLVHGYSTVVPETLWNTAIHDIPAIIVEVTKLLDSVAD